MRDNLQSRLVEAGRTVSSFIIIPNIPFWIASHFLFVAPRPIFNLDYLAAALAGLFLPRTLFISASLLLFLVDTFFTFAPTYYLSRDDLIASVRFVSELSWRPTAKIGAFLGAIALGWVLLAIKVSAYQQQKHRKTTSIALIGVILFLGTYTVVNNSTRLRPRDSVTWPTLATSQALKLGIAIGDSLKQDNTGHKPFLVPSASAELLGGLRQVSETVDKPEDPHNLVVVLVESYGLSNDRNMARILDAPYHSSPILEKYNVRAGITKFHGSTVAAEFRELCGFEAGISSVRLAQQLSQLCLPLLLRQQGYETVAIHGFSGYMFDRRAWYRDLGFEKQLFLEQLRELPTMRTCDGVFFSGICDSDIAKLIGDRLTVASKTNPQFVYWVTLNSHLPVHLSRSSPAALGCGSQDTAKVDGVVREWMRLVCRANAAVAELATRPNLPPTEFLIVGDHAPPFSSNNRRDQFSQTEVPFIHLRPRPTSPVPRVLSRLTD